jgi:hypothetical protein
VILPGPRGAPSPALPLAYLLLAAGAFVLAATALPWLAPVLAAHYYHPRILALTHTVGLGWITLAIMGASYQLVPIVLERPLWSTRLARWQLPVLVAGVAGMVGHFWLARWNGLAWAAGLVALGILSHGVNVGRSLRGLPRWTATTRAFAGALAGLGLAALLGLTLAANRLWPVLAVDPLAVVHAHFHVALLGWVAPMIVGVATRVYPMFLLAPEPSAGATTAQLAGLGVGALGIGAGLLGAPLLGLAGALAAAAALAGHAAWVVRMVRARRRPRLDWGLRFVLTGTACLVPAGLLGLGLAAGLVQGPRAALAYAILALGGWVSLTIVGMLLKIAPFLVWYRAYGPHVGRQPVPSLAQLSSARAEAVAYGCLVGGVGALAPAIGLGAPWPWIAAAGTLVAVGACCLGGILVCVVRHLGTPRGLAGATDERSRPAAARRGAVAR